MDAATLASPPRAPPPTRRILGRFGSVTVIAQLFDTDTVIVSFNHIALLTQGSRFWGDAFFEKNRISSVGVMTDTANWYPAADMAQAVAAIREATRGRRLVTYGNSHGGYGALKFSAALAAAAAVAFSPQGTIDPRILGERDTRYSNYHAAGVSGGDPILGADLCDHCYVIHDRFDPRDEFNVDLISAAGLAAGRPIIAVGAAFTGHASVSLIAESGLGPAFVSLFCRPQPPESHVVKQLLRAARVRSVTYLTLRAHHLLPRLPAFRRQLCSGLRRMRPGPRRIMLVVYLAEAGRLDRAGAILERADPALLDRFGFLLLWKLFRRTGLVLGELLVMRAGLRLHPEDRALPFYATNSFLRHGLRAEATATFTAAIDQFGLQPHFAQTRQYAQALGLEDVLARLDIGDRRSVVAPRLLPRVAADGGISYQAAAADVRTEKGASMDWLDWETVGGRPLIRAADGPLRPILTEAGQAPKLDRGWRLRGVYAGFAPFLIADLAHDDGAAGYWVFDPDRDPPNLRIVGNDMTPPAGAVGDAFQAAVSARLLDIAHRMLTDATAPQDPMVRGFMHLSRKLRQMLHAMLPASALEGPPLRQVDLLTTSDTVWPVTTPAGDPILLEKDLMMRALHHFLHERFLDACTERRLRWPALTRLGLGDRVHGIFFRSDLGVLRCVDPPTGLVYYIVLMGADIASVAVMVPAADLIFTYSNGAPTIFIGMLAQSPGMIGAALARHQLCGPETYLDWLERQPSRFAQFTWPESVAHLGHFLWNEASGLERIVAALQPADQPAIFNLCGPSGYEFYAPLETLYPEFRGRVENGLDSLEAMQDHACAHAIQPIRVSDAVVSAAIRRRVMAVVAADPEVAMLARMGGPPLDPAIPVVVLGLRLSDRTHGDLGGFYRRVIAHLLEQTPRLTVVIDGLNARPGRGAGATFRVFSGGGSPVDLYAREKALVAQLRADTASLPVDIVDCVGVGMRINLFWIDRAQMFVAPWGAGLVKYRWVCNKPGFVFSSRNNLTQPHHLPIYHLPRFMEEPTPIEFVDPAHVTDLRDPSEVLDADGRDAQERIGGLSAVNFAFDEAPVLARIAALFRQTHTADNAPAAVG